MALCPDAADLQKLPVTICLGAVDILFGGMATRGLVELAGCYLDRASRLANSCGGLLRLCGCSAGLSILLVYLWEVTWEKKISRIRLGE